MHNCHAERKQCMMHCNGAHRKIMNDEFYWVCVLGQLTKNSFSVARVKAV